jgi:hypothetical protein
MAEAFVPRPGGNDLSPGVVFASLGTHGESNSLDSAGAGVLRAGGGFVLQFRRVST